MDIEFTKSWPYVLIGMRSGYTGAFTRLSS